MIIFFFYFFFDELYYIEDIQQAFKNICLNKMLSDGYFDMSLINCPDDFEKCHTHLEKLVKMQHYGLPTRLLDITRNPLVALYFACESNLDTYGELVLISAENHEIKYPQSDTASVLLIEKKEEILEQLEHFSINRATLFPEIECVAEYLKKKYS